MTKRHGDFILCGIIWVVAIVFWKNTVGLMRPTNILPTIMIITMSVLAGIIFIHNFVLLLKDKNAQSPKLFTKKTITKVTALSIALILYAFIMPITGFYFTTAVFVGSLSYVMAGPGLNWKEALKSMIGGCFVSLFIFLSFGYLLNVNPPKGLFF